MKLSKDDIRGAMRLRVGTQPADRRAAASQAICERLRASQPWREAASLLLYVPLKDEPDVWPLIEEALAAGRTVALPRYDGARQCYTACVVRDLRQDLVPGRFGIREPAPSLPALTAPEFDLVLAPGLAFDRQGHRLGRGKGYYDRLLAGVRGRRCGVAFEFQVAPEIPVEPHDVRLDLLVTEAEWREFGATDTASATAPADTGEPVPYLDLKAQMAPLRAELDAAIARVLDQCAFILGPEVARFEEAFAAYVGARHCVAMNSGTSALHVAMLLAGVGPGDEVITTPFTFAATSWAISYAGARPVYVDIEEGTFNLDPQQVAAAITPRTKALLPVHLYGHPCQLEPLLALAGEAGLPLIEDAAQAHGAKYRGQTVGGFGQTACFSFYPGKNLGACGEGGALVTSDDALAARARALRDHGSKRRYHHDEIGFNYRMEGLTGAILGVKLKRLEQWTAARRRHAQRYAERLAGLPLTLPHEAPYAESAWHLYVCRTPRRDELAAHLEARRIGYSTHYPLPLHLQRCYAGLRYREGDFPVAERAAREVIALPVFPEMTEAQQDRVIRVVREFFSARAV